MKIEKMIDLSWTEEKFNKAMALKTLSQKVDILKQLNYQNLEPTKQDVKNWQLSRLIAIDYMNPDFTDYIRVLDDIMIDGHVSGIMQTVKDILQAREFEIVSSAEKVDEGDVRDLFDQEWFYRFIEYYVESLFYPFSLIQLGNLNTHKRFDEMELIPREHVTPQNTWIKKYAYITTPGNDVGWNFQTSELEKYFIFLSGRIIPGMNKLGVNHLGLLDKAAYHALGKKYMLIYWWRYGEIFGVPFRHGQTDVHDNVRRKNLEETFRNAGSNQWAVTDLEDKISLVEPKSMTSRGNIFRELMDYSDEQISKSFIGSTSITDEKSFVGSAQVGERIFELRGKSMLRKLKFIINNQLIPRMEFYGLPVSGYYFRWKNEDTITFEQRIKAIDSLKEKYDFDEQEISTIVGFKVIKKEPVAPVTKQDIQTRTSVMQAVAELYKNI